MNGHIITAGLFDKDELVRINKFAETKRRTTDPFPVPAPQIMREGINDSTDQLLALFNDHEQLNHMLTFYKALHKIEQFLVDRNQNTFSVYSLDTALIDANFINDTKNAFENPWRIDKARIKISGDPHEGRQSAFFYTAILQRLHAIKPDHPELRAHHQKALRDHEFCFEFALARRNTIKIMQYDAKISEKKEAAAFLKNRLATLDKMAAKRGISPEGIAGLHAVVYGGKLPSVFDETAAFLELLNKAKQALQDDIRTKQRRLQTLIP
jgi:hypothetical protein